MTVRREGRKWKYDETCDSPNLGHVHTGENLDSCPEMVHDKEHILKILSEMNKNNMMKWIL